MIEVMEIVAIKNNEIYPQKEKYNLCISPNWFFLINSNDRKIYRPNLKILETDYSFLKQDSYICCSRIFEYGVINNYRKLGLLSKETAQKIIEILPSVRTLTANEIDCIQTAIKNQI